MKELKIRSYRGEDTEQLVDLWNKSLPQDPIGLELFMRKILLDANFDPEGLLVAEYKGQPVGMMYCLVRKTPIFGLKVEEDRGWMTMFFVHPDFRRRGVAARMFERACDYFRAEGRPNVYVSPYAPNYFFPGVDMERHKEAEAFLARLGFETDSTPVSMEMFLTGFYIPDDVREVRKVREAEGYSFVIATLKLVVPALEFIAANFSADWARSVREGLQHGVPLSHLLVALDNGKVIGFCMYGGYDYIQERFGPFGVDETYRGKGIGKVLLYMCLEEMRKNGSHNAWFLWTGEERASGHLYKRAGFKVTRRFRIMKRAVTI